MGCYFGPELIAAGKTWYLITILGVDLLICLALFFFLRKKQSLAGHRENLNNSN